MPVDWKDTVKMSACVSCCNYWYWYSLKNSSNNRTWICDSTM